MPIKNKSIDDIILKSNSLLESNRLGIMSQPPKRNNMIEEMIDGLKQ